MTVTYKLLELKVKMLPEAAGKWHYFHFHLSIHMLPSLPVNNSYCFLYPLLKLYYMYLKMYVTPSFESYQMTTHSALKLGYICSVEFEGKLIGCNVAVKQFRCWTVRPVNIEIFKPVETTFVLLKLLLELNM